jgi:hypothetical protein
VAVDAELLRKDLERIKEVEVLLDAVVHLVALA